MFQWGKPGYLCVAVLLASVAKATIIECRSLEIDLTDNLDAAAKCIWSEPEIITVTEEGMGWDDGSPASFRDGWIHTLPYSVGLSWRCPASISVNVTIRPEEKEIVLDNGQVTTPYPGDVYARYSADRAHWSSWQVLQQGAAGTWNPETGRHYYCTLQVPLLERESYSGYSSEYMEMDVPWMSDEYALCRWIEDEHPGFFLENIPFIGYVEFLYEGSFSSGRRLEAFTAEIVFAVSGVHCPPEDDSVYQDRDLLPWSFSPGIL